MLTVEMDDQDMVKKIGVVTMVVMMASNSTVFGMEKEINLSLKF
jgi:hypothetical protein